MRQHLAAIALVVRDYDEAIAYYTKVVGFELIEDTDMSVGHNSQPGKRWVRVKPKGANETSFLLAKAATAEQIASIGNQTGGRVFLFLNTDDFWRDYHAMTANGVTWVRPPSREAYGTVAVFADIYGNKWDLIGPNVDE
jgi:catechol 2,3-dioxygenase-like lactoylglutathione lyase family enzyme